MPTADATTHIVRLKAETHHLYRKVQAQGDAIYEDWHHAIERPDFMAGARNLADYLALRQIDLTALQAELASCGLSSLGRSESHIRAALATVCAALDCMTGETVTWPERERLQIGFDAIARGQARFFGDNGLANATRIMVTLPSEAADDGKLLQEIIAAGASCVRINCAHDGTKAWGRMIGHAKAAALQAGRDCPVIMDIGGPKIRVVDIHSPSKRLHRGDRLRIVNDANFLTGKTATMTISHPGLIERLKPGAAVLIDDGKIGARVSALIDGGVELEATVVRDKGVKLKPEKGINFPSIEIDMAPVTPDDLVALDFIADHADVIGFSFVQRPSDVDMLVEALAMRRGGRPRQPLLLKIETALAVKNLPRLLVSAGGRHPVAVMIARGDLAMEVGPERLSEVQEEILWLCEAAHVPVVWATQVLESLVKDGAPSRAEVTDAAMGQRAECVMLNKGPFIVEGVRFLAGILKRMDRHQFKKTARLSALTSWKGNQALP